MDIIDQCKEIKTQVLVVGSGPMGSTYARKLVDAGIEVLMVDVGAQETKNPGAHKKNVITYQKNINGFINVIQGELQKLSVPTQDGVFPTLNPASFSSKEAIWGFQNPLQKADVNLDATAATRTVGGMAAHWTCCTPEPHKNIERPATFSEEEWAALFSEARRRIHTPIDGNGEGTQFENSIRQQLVKRTLQGAFPSSSDPKDPRVFKAMPLACQRAEDNLDWVEWSAADTVLGDIVPRDGEPGNDLFQLKAEHQCIQVLRDEETGSIKGAIVEDLRHKDEYVKPDGTKVWRTRKLLVRADAYVLAAGAVLTPQILAKSNFDNPEILPALGKYMTEQTMTFCQIVLKKSLLDSVERDPYHLGWDKIAKEHRAKYPQDALPIPFNDYDPQVTQPLSETRPWHTQIHRDAFSYGLVPDIYDQRAIVDLRFFGYVDVNPDNRVEFSRDIWLDDSTLQPGITDSYGMPQPTFFFKLSEDDAKRADEMMTDMNLVASKLGGFLPGALPQFLAPGAALHICGTTRAGETKEDSCVDRNSRVHGSSNLFLAGCNVIPSAMACNPTLTAMCYAIQGANTIVEDFRNGVYGSVPVKSAKKVANGVDGAKGEKYTNGTNGTNGVKGFNCTNGDDNDH